MSKLEGIENRLMKMIMDLDRDMLHAGIIVLTVEDYYALCEAVKPEIFSDIREAETPSDIRNARLTTFRNIPIALSLRYRSSHIITQETIDIIESYKRSNKVDEE